MAMDLNEQLVTIQGPNGNTVQVPASLANAFQGATPVQPNQALNDYAGKPAPVADQTDPLQVTPGTDLKPLPPIQSTPQQMAQDAAPTAPVRPAAKVTKGQRPPKTAPAPQDPNLAPGPITAAQQKVSDATEHQVDASNNEANVDAARDVMLADARASSNQDIDKQTAALQQNAQKGIDDAKAKYTEMVGMRKKIADTKIDRSLDHPFLAALGAVIAAIGQAFDHKSGPNPALEIIFKQIDRKVAGQMQNIDQMKDVLGITEKEADRLNGLAEKQSAKDKLVVSALADKYARQAEEIGMRSSSEKTKAHAAFVASELRAHAAQNFEAAVKDQVEFDEKKRAAKAQVSLGYAGIAAENKRQDKALAQSQLFHDDNNQLDREKMAQERDIALGKIMAEKGSNGVQAKLAQEKYNNETGIGNASTGDFLLNKDGYAKMDQAKALDAQADALEKSGAVTPEQTAAAKKLREQSAALRYDAQTSDVFHAGDTANANKLKEKYAATQTVATLTDDIKNLSNDDTRTWFSTGPNQAAIQAKQSQLMLTLKNAYDLGVLSKGDQKILVDQMGKDPTKWDFNTAAGALGLGTDPDAFKARLTTISDGLESQLMNDMRTNHWNVTDEQAKLIFHKQKAEDSTGGKLVSALSKDTPSETVDNEGVLARAWNSRGANPDSDERADAAGVKEDSRFPGLGVNKTQADAISDTLAKANKGDKGAIGALVGVTNDPKRGPLIVAAAQQALQDGKLDVSVYDAMRAGAKSKEAQQIFTDRDQAARVLPDKPGMQVPVAVAKRAATRADMASRPLDELAAIAAGGFGAQSDLAFDTLAQKATSDKSAQMYLKAVQDQKAKQTIRFTTPNGQAVPQPRGK